MPDQQIPLADTAPPSMTRQEPYVQSIVEALGGKNILEIVAVRRMQKQKPG